METSEKTKKVNNISYAVSSIAFASGAGYAIYKKIPFWKGFGLAVIVSIIGSFAAYGTASLVIKENAPIVKS